MRNPDIILKGSSHSPRTINHSGAAYCLGLYPFGRWCGCPFGQFLPNAIQMSYLQRVFAHRRFVELVTGLSHDMPRVSTCGHGKIHLIVGKSARCTRQKFIFGSVVQRHTGHIRRASQRDFHYRHLGGEVQADITPSGFGRSSKSGRHVVVVAQSFLGARLVHPGIDTVHKGVFAFGQAQGFIACIDKLGNGLVFGIVADGERMDFTIYHQGNFIVRLPIHLGGRPLCIAQDNSGRCVIARQSGTDGHSPGGGRGFVHHLVLLAAAPYTCARQDQQAEK